jgi:hypothetical protein
MANPHMEMVNHCLHMEIENIWLPVFIWGSLKENGVQQILVWKQDSKCTAPCFHIGITKWESDTISRNQFEINSKRWPVSIRGQFSH